MRQFQRQRPPLEYLSFSVYESPVGSSEMTQAQRGLVVGTLLTIAGGFAFLFVEYRGDVANAIHQEGLITPLGQTSRDAYPWEGKLPAGFRLDVQSWSVRAARIHKNRDGIWRGTCAHSSRRRSRLLGPGKGENMRRDRYITKTLAGWRARNSLPCLGFHPTSLVS
jgi:hypothetical protein